MSTFNAGAIEANLTLDRSSWVRAYRDTLTEVQRLENISIDIPIDADTRVFAATVDNVQRQLRDLENESINIPVDADVGDAMTNLIILERMMDRMDGRNINVDVDVDQSPLDRLQTSIGGLIGGGGGGGGHLGLLRVALYALVLLSPVVSSAILGIVGAVVAFAGAVVSAGGAAAILGVGILGLISRFKELKESGDPLPPQYQALADSLDSLGDAYDKFLDSIEGPGLDLMVRAVDTLTRIVPDMTPIFNNAAEAVSGLLDEFNNWVGGPDYTEMLDFFGRLGPDMITSFGHIFGNLAVFFGQVMDAFEPLIRSMMGGLEDITAGWADWARGLEDDPAFQDFLDDIQTYGPEALQILVSFYNALRNIGEALEPFASPMAEGLINFFDVIANLEPDQLTLIISGLSGLWLAFQAGPPIIGAVAAALTPVGLAIAAIAAVIGVVAFAVMDLWQTNQDFRDDVIAIWEGIRDTFAPILADIQGYFQEHQGTVRAAQGVWREFKGVVAAAMDLIRSIIERVLPIIQAIWSRWGDDIMRVTDGALTGILNIIRGVLQVVRGFITMWSGLISGDWRKMFSGMVQITNGTMAVFRTLWNGFLAFWRGIFNLLTGAARQGMTNAGTVIRNAANAVTGALRNIWNDFVGWFGGLGGRIAGAAAGMWSGITGALSGVIANARDMINSLGFDIHVPAAFPGPSTYHVGVQLARGGVIDEPTLAMIGEGGETEIVTPERKMRDIVENYSAADIDYGRMAQEIGAVMTRTLAQTQGTTNENSAYIKVDAGQDPSRVASTVVDGISFELRRLGFGGKNNL